jgi:hypothetical protein
MREAFFIPHLGLGDHIICNGILRKLRESYDIVRMPVKHHNLLNIQDMFKDDSGIELISVTGDAEAIKYRDRFKDHVSEIIGVGYYGQNFLQDSSSFDESFYKQAEMEHNDRWELFLYDRDIVKETALYDASNLPGKYIFVHDDISRNYEIENSFFEENLFIFRPSHQFGTDCETTLFHYGKIIENASEIHCIDSSFACYIEHLDCSAVEKMVLHRYIKQEKEFDTQDKNHPFFPQYRQKWEII